MRASRAEVDLGAIRHNVELLVREAAPAALCAVVKADGYGHGAIAVSEAAVSAGASWLGVALVEEGAVLRRSGVEVPILLLSQPRPEDIDAAVRFDMHLTLYTEEGIEAAEAAALCYGRTPRVHLKVNTGMNRVGAAPCDVAKIATRVSASRHLELEGVWTHCAVADEPENPFTEAQLEVFDSVLYDLEEIGIVPPMRHVANSAVLIDRPSARHDLVRAGISLYGLAPSQALEGRLDLVPALSLVAEVSMVKRVGAQERISYGLRHRFTHDTTVATVPIGYADGVPRRLSAVGGEVLIAGRRRPIVGVVTMDQIMVDCGDDDVSVGDEVVLLGTQGDERIGAGEWAESLDTIAYEIVCGIGPRVPRIYR